MREQVLRIVRSAGAPMSACSIAQELSLRQAGIHSSAVFRAVNELMTAGLVDRIETLACYVPSRSPAISAICSECGSFEEIAAPELVTGLTAFARTVGWTPRRLVIEVLGRCRRCDWSDGRTDA